MRLYTNEKTVAFIDFKATNSSPPYGFFTPSNVAASSWNDLVSAESFSVAGDSVNHRRFYIGDVRIYFIFVIYFRFNFL